MKKYKSIGKLLAVSFFTAVIASACTEDAMDKVNKLSLIHIWTQAPTSTETASSHPMNT